MSIHTQPSGTDVLRARQAEMDGHPHAWLGMAPEQVHATVGAMVTRLLAVEAALTPLDGLAFPQPDPLADVASLVSASRPDLAGVHRVLWPALETLVARVPAALARLAKLAGEPPEVEGPSLSVLGQATAEMAIHGGRLPRQDGRDVYLIKHLIPRVLDVETRLRKLQGGKPQKDAP